MKIKRLVTIEIPDELEIVGATLPTLEDSNYFSDNLCIYNTEWWLNTPLDHISGCVFIICTDGDATYEETNCDYITVRPALQIKNLELSNLKIGDCFIFGEKEFEIVLNDLAFCKSDIGKCYFRQDFEADNANVYEFSDVKKFVDKWFNESVGE